VALALVALIATEVPGEVLVALATAMLSGGLVTAWVSVRKSSSEVELTTVQSMQIALTELRIDLKRANEKADQLERALMSAMAERDAWKERAQKADPRYRM
jgi:hypothetical protein